MAITLSLFAQKDWNTVNFADEYKLNIKISKGFAKQLQSGPTFIANYQLHQATLMKGSETTTTSGVHAEISLNGIEMFANHDLADQMYQEFVEELQSIISNLQKDVVKNIKAEL